MATVNLNYLPTFRKNSLKMADNIRTMVSKMDAVLDSDISDSDKESEVEALINTYLPQ